MIGADTLWLFLIGLPALALGTWLGLKLFGKLDDQAFRVAVAGGALDEAAPHAGRVHPQPTFPAAERAEDVRAHFH